MPHAEIFFNHEKAAFEFITRQWALTHQLVNQPVIYPTIFSAEIMEYNFGLRRLIFKNYLAVTTLVETDFDLRSYEAKFSHSVLYSLTMTIIQKILNYVNHKRKDFFRQEVNTSQPRYLLCIYFCRRLAELASLSIDVTLKRQYQQELEYLDGLHPSANQHFPTATKNDGRNGLHALLLAIQLSIEEMLTVIDIYLERKTLKEHIDHLQIICGNLMIRFIHHIPYILSNLPWEEDFIYHDFINPQQLQKYPLLRKSVIGQWLLDLHRLSTTAELPNLTQTNPWLANPSLLFASLQQDAAVAAVFKNDAALLGHYVVIFGLLAEMTLLNKFLQNLSQVSGSIGDYNMIINQNLGGILSEGLNSWRILISRLQETLAELKQRSISVLEKKPGTTEPWKNNLIHWWGFNSALIKSMLESEEIIKNINNLCQRVRQINQLDFTSQLQQLKNYAIQLHQRQIQLGVAQFNAMEYPDMSTPHIIFVTPAQQNLKGKYMPRRKPKSSSRRKTSHTTEAVIRERDASGLTVIDIDEFGRNIKKFCSGALGKINELYPKFNQPQAIEALRSVPPDESFMQYLKTITGQQIQHLPFEFIQNRAGTKTTISVSDCCYFTIWNQFADKNEKCLELVSYLSMYVYWQYVLKQLAIFRNFLSALYDGSVNTRSLSLSPLQCDILLDYALRQSIQRRLSHQQSIPENDIKQLVSYQRSLANVQPLEQLSQIFQTVVNYSHIRVMQQILTAQFGPPVQPASNFFNSFFTQHHQPFFLRLARLHAPTSEELIQQIQTKSSKDAPLSAEDSLKALADAQKEPAAATAALDNLQPPPATGYILKSCEDILKHIEDGGNKHEFLNYQSQYSLIALYFHAIKLMNERVAPQDRNAADPVPDTATRTLSSRELGYRKAKLILNFIYYAICENSELSNRQERGDLTPEQKEKLKSVTAAFLDRKIEGTKIKMADHRSRCCLFRFGRSDTQKLLQPLLTKLELELPSPGIT